jgi:hypothetical protein
MPGKMISQLFPLTEEEVTFLRELQAEGGRFLVVGMSAAVLQGTDVGTKDIDLWLEHQLDEGLGKAARAVGGVFIWRADPPTLGGPALSRFDLVNHCHGLDDFDVEYSRAVDAQLEGIPLKILPLDRVIASKRATGRPKDKAAMPALKAALMGLKLKGGL